MERDKNFGNILFLFFRVGVFDRKAHPEGQRSRGTKAQRGQRFLGILGENVVDPFDPFDLAQGKLCSGQVFVGFWSPTPDRKSS